MNVDTEIAAAIQSLKKPVILGISGFGGSGKSTIAVRLGKQLNAPVVGVDSFQRRGMFTESFSLWNVMDYRRLEREVLEPFSKGKSVTYGHFNGVKELISETITLENNGILIVEGVGLFRPELIKYFNYKIWIDVPIEQAIARGKKRDREEYNNPTDELWEGVWKMNDVQYSEQYKPKELADVVIDNAEA